MTPCPRASTGNSSKPSGSGNSDTPQRLHQHNPDHPSLKEQHASLEVVTMQNKEAEARPTIADGIVDVERWDDAFELDAHQSFEHIFDQLHRLVPRSPLSDSSDQSDYFQPHAHNPSAKTASKRRVSYSSYTHALPTPPTTTTATTLMSSKPTQSTLGDHGSRNHSSQTTFKRLVSSTEAYLKADSRGTTPTNTSAISIKFGKINNNHKNNGNNSNGIHNKFDALPPLMPSASPRTRDRSETAPCATSTVTGERGSEHLSSSASSQSPSPISSTSSSPRAVTASVTAPSTVAASTVSLWSKDKNKNKNKNKDLDKDLDKDKDSENNSDNDRNKEEGGPVLCGKSMTTITQDMMLSNLPAYSGIITRINPIKRVAAWVDDLEDLEVPEEDLDFSHVRSILAKSSSVPETLESVDSWDTDSESSALQCDTIFHVESRTTSRAPPTASQLSVAGLLPSPLAGFFQAGDSNSTQRTGLQISTISASETIETLDDDFDLPEDFGSLRLNLQAREQRQCSVSPDINLPRRQSSLLQWQDSGSEMDELEFGTPLDNLSLTSSVSCSRDSMGDEDNLLDGIIFPEAMESLQLVTTRPYRPDTDPSIFGKESRIQEDQDDFWEGLDIGSDDVFNRKGRNRNLVVRAVPLGRERSSSRVQREIVPLKDFVALPSRIPRLCRALGDTSRPVTPAPSLSRMHSTKFELPLRNLKSKSSLPRLKRSSISRRESARASLVILTSDGALASSEGSSAYSSRAPTPTASHFPSSKRNSLLFNKDDLPSFKSSSLAMRSVSFTEPAESAKPQEILDTKETPSIPQPPTPKPPASQLGVKPFQGLRTLVKKLELVRPRFSTRGLVPLSESTPHAVTLQPSEPFSPVSSEDSTGEAKRPPNSRTSSFTDWGSILASTETTKESRPPSRAGLVSLGDISEVSTTDIGESVTPVAAAERFSRRLFLKRSPKHSMFGDGSELDRFDNLPTYGARGSREDEKMQATQLMAQVRKQSTDRVTAWLRKPQSIANFKDINKAEVIAVEAEPPSSKMRKSKSIRRSLFDIFGQTASADSSKEKEKAKDKDKQREQDKEKDTKRKKRRLSNGPTLIRDLSQSRVRKVSGMVYNPMDKMWDGNDDILNEFEDDENAPAPFESPSPPAAHSYFSTSPLLAASRPALISNMSQYSKQRTQVAGKMVFDPVRMCWIINPEYISRRRQQKEDGHRRQRSLDEAWGDEPDVFAGLSDSDKSQDEQLNQEDGQDEDQEWDREGTTGSNSMGRVKGNRLLSRPSFQRYSSQERLAEEERLRAWAETMRPSLANEAADSRPTSMGVHSIVPKSSRKSLNGVHHAGCSSGVGGGGYSSRGEFEVGVEFDVTDAFLEQCIAAEAQHRREAGKFFALPCTPAVSEVRAAAPSRLSKMTSSKMLTLGKKSGTSKGMGKDSEKAHAKGKQKDLIADRVNQKANERERERDKGQENVKSKPGKVLHEDLQDTAADKKAKTNVTSFPSNPLLSWPPRSRSKSKSMVSRLLDIEGDMLNHQPIERSGKLAPLPFNAKQNQVQVSGNTGSKNGKSKSFGRAGLFAFASSHSFTSSAAPAAATLAARGRGGSQDVFFHRLPSKRDSMRESLSFAATLAVSRRGAVSHDRRRIGNHTFDPLNNIKCIDGDPGEETAWKEDTAKDEEEEDFIERGYRVMSNARGRPPLRPRTELILEFECHGHRFQ